MQKAEGSNKEIALSAFCFLLSAFCLRSFQLRLVHSQPSHCADAEAPVFVDIEPIDLYVGRNEMRQRIEGRMNSKRRRNEID